MTDCIFCSIAHGHTPAFIVHENSHVIAFMDTNPINAGHVLVTPRIHEEHLQDLPENIYSEVMLAGRKIARILNALYSPKKVGLAVAGFDISHAHLHVIPLHHYHDLTSRHYLEGTPKKPAPADLKMQAEKILQGLQS